MISALVGGLVLTLSSVPGDNSGKDGGQDRFKISSKCFIQRSLCSTSFLMVFASLSFTGLFGIMFLPDRVCNFSFSPSCIPV